MYKAISLWDGKPFEKTETGEPHHITKKILKLQNLNRFQTSKFLQYFNNNRYRYGHPKFCETICNISTLIYDDLKINNDTDYIDMQTILKIIDMSEKALEKDHPLKREIADFIFDNLRANIDKFSNKDIIKIIRNIAIYNKGNFVVHNIVYPEFNKLNNIEFINIIKYLIEEQDGIFYIYMYLPQLRTKAQTRFYKKTNKTLKELYSMDFYEFKKLFV